MANIVSMTVFIKESRYEDRFVEMRKDFFQNGNYPGNELIAVTNFASPGIEVEIQAVGVIGDSSADQPCSAEGLVKKKQIVPVPGGRWPCGQERMSPLWVIARTRNALTQPFDASGGG